MTENYEELFKAFEQEFLDTKRKDYYVDYLTEARQIIDDIKYFNAHINRTRKGTRFDYQISLGYNGRIMTWFIRELFFQPSMLKESDMMLRLKIYDITYSIFKKIQWDEKNQYNITKKYIEKAVEWSPVLYHFTVIVLKDHISNFVECSHSGEEIRKIWNEIETRKEQDNGND